MNAVAILPESNVVVLPLVRPANRVKKSRFIVREFRNPKSVSWRVTGRKRDGTRIRENFSDEAQADARQIELELEYKRSDARSELKATKLSDDQLSLAHLAFLKLGDDWPRLLDAIDYWRNSAASRQPTESPRIDDAVEQYLKWLDAAPFREPTKRGWKIRIKIFKNSVPNMRVSEVTPETIDEFLATRNVSPSGKDTDRRAASRFFSWCIERPRRWINSNPCREVKVEMGEPKPPVILSVKEAEKLLRAAENYSNGKLAKYTAVCTFAGIRPFGEAKSISNNRDAIKLKDRTIRIESNESKTGRKTGCGRVVEICDTLHAWLKRYEKFELYPPNWRKDFDEVKRLAGFDPNLKPWPDDVMRHTAISHYVQRNGSYAKAVKQFGTSETIIKKHYEARVSSDDTKKFYAIMPKKGGAK